MTSKLLPMIPGKTYTDELPTHSVTKIIEQSVAIYSLTEYIQEWFYNGYTMNNPLNNKLMQEITLVLDEIKLNLPQNEHNNKCFAI